MKYQIERTTQFKRDYKLAKKRGCNLDLLWQVIRLLADGEKLPPEYHDHFLVGEYSGYKECHIKPDWLLIYLIEKDMLILTLVNTGSHADLFR